jgi:predicted GIY-YIG superfamily endonuclease
MNSFNIYILELENGCYFIGKSKSENLEKVIKQHQEGNSTEWTKINKPKKLLEITIGTSIDEDRITKEYMYKYGIDKVRSTTISKIILTELEINLIKKEIRVLKHLCIRCGRKEHYIIHCNEEKDIDGYIIKEQKEDIEFEIYFCSKCEKQFDNSDKCKKHEKYCNKKKIYCHRCGRKNHYAKECYAKINKDGEDLSSDFYESNDSDDFFYDEY